MAGSTDGAQHFWCLAGLDPLPQSAAVAKGSTNTKEGKGAGDRVRKYDCASAAPRATGVITRFEVFYRINRSAIIRYREKLVWLVKDKGTLNSWRAKLPYIKCNAAKGEKII